MKINPVLRNESKLAVRSIKFNLTILFYVLILSIGTILFYRSFVGEIYASGTNPQYAVTLYIAMAIIQAFLLMFIVPSLTSTAICSEREKQTLDILLSTRLSTLQIILGKLFSSSLRVIVLIICTIPIYSICGLIGGVKISNILMLTLSFIVNTIFVGSIGILVSTYVRTSKVATAVAYSIILFIFAGLIIIGLIIFMIKINKIKYAGSNQIQIPYIIYLSPATGFFTMLNKQVGIGDISYMFGRFSLLKNADYISIIIQVISSVLCVMLAARKLNPLNSKRTRKVKNKKVKE